ncbi:MAG: type III effector protein [Verrucomicrobia bacterium]|nr:MAG: type III effector protein [Verrucomicrobiota bacterium]
MSTIPKIRAQLPLKSPSKHYGFCDAEIPPKKCARYRQEASEERAQQLILIRSEEVTLLALWNSAGLETNFSLLAKHIRRYGSNAAGNCMEYSILLYDDLSHQLGPGDFQDIVKFESGDHVFNVVNQPKGTDGTYPKHFSDWDERALIVDGWLNVCCPAREYPERWRAQMHKWAARDLKLGLDGISPLDPTWLNLVDESEKISAPFRELLW